MALATNCGRGRFGALVVPWPRVIPESSFYADNCILSRYGNGLGRPGATLLILIGSPGLIR